MDDQADNMADKKSWRRPQIVEVGQVDELTTAGVGNVGDFTGTDHWKAGTVEVQPAELPDGE